MNYFRQVRTSFLTAFSVLILVSLTSATLVEAKGPKKNKVDFWLTVLHNNDGESQLINAGEGLQDFGGIARFATLVDDLRVDAKRNFRGKSASILLSSGDNFLAGPEFNASLAKGVPFFDSIALDIIGYDAFAIGNHEFDFGPDILEDFILGFNFTPPFVSVNLDFGNEPGLQALRDMGIIVDKTVIKKKGEKIGVVGATTPELPFISSPRNTIVLQNIAELVQNEINELENKGINKIILISHLQDIDEDLILAQQLEGLDIMIAGGGGELLANPGDLLVPGDSATGTYPEIAFGADGAEIPVITTPGDYKYVGRLAVGFNRDGEIIKIDENSGLVRVAGGDNPDAVRPNRRIQRRVVEPVQEFVSELAANVIATSEVALEGRRDPGIRTQETNLGNLTADSLRFQAAQLASDFGVPEPDVALQNGGGIRNNSLIPAGDITELTTFDILPFTNFVTIVPEIPRNQFKEIMEHAVAVLPGAGGQFAQISGFSIVVDTTGTAQEVDADGNVIVPGSRIVDLILDDGTDIVVGGVLQPGDDITVATIDFLARGGDAYPYRNAPFTSIGVTYQQALFNFITEPVSNGGLEELISATEYPEGGEGRIVILP